MNVKDENHGLAANIEDGFVQIKRTQTLKNYSTAQENVSHGDPTSLLNMQNKISWIPGESINETSHGSKRINT